MNGRGRQARRLAFVAGTALALLIGAAPRHEAPTIVVSEGNGDVIARLPLPLDGRLALRYRHSIYREPALETFLVGSDHSLRLFELSSPSTAVLDHYALSGHRSVREGWHVLRPASEHSYERLPLIATVTGRRTLVVGERRLPLFTPGRARHLTICVRYDEDACH
jgi:hypothetical protein